ncbi:MAG: diguanylate cyclase [Rhodobacteraceae bacterium]|nr:diguanylate cyclase [Paracoccaceae bacterium]
MGGDAYDERPDPGATLRLLERYDVLEAGPEEEFEHITDLARLIFAVPMAAISLADGHRQWLKAQRGLVARHGALDLAFTPYVLASDAALMVDDARYDPRFASDPAVRQDGGIRSYLGAPLRTPEGQAIGVICIMDTVPRDFSEVDAEVMQQLARMTIGNLELRLITSKDAQTGAATRRAFLDTAGRELERRHRYGGRVAIVALALEGLGQMAVERGPGAGDALVAEAAGAVQGVMRRTDVLGRLGPTSFAVLLSGATASEALQAARRFREALGVIDHKLEVRAGVAAASADHASAMEWLAEAEAALTLARAHGESLGQAVRGAHDPGRPARLN